MAAIVGEGSSLIHNSPIVFGGQRPLYFPLGSSGDVAPLLVKEANPARPLVNLSFSFNSKRRMVSVIPLSSMGLRAEILKVCETS